MGAQGEHVRALQRRLTSLGFRIDPIDGIFGSRTVDAVKAFQQSRRMNADGIVGPETMRQLGLTVPPSAPSSIQVCRPPAFTPPRPQDMAQRSTTAVSQNRRPQNDRRTGGFTANSAIQSFDSRVRLNQYVDPAQQAAARVLNDLEAGRISHMDARIMASGQRNALLTSTRQQLSPGGRALSRALKEEGKTLPELVQRYAHRLLENSPELRRQHGLSTLDPNSRLFNRALYTRAVEELGRSEAVSREIIHAAGRPNATVTAVARFSRVAGPAAVVGGLALSGYEIRNAPEGQRLYTAGREASGIGGGVIGSMGGGLVAGWTASLMCGPGAPVCAMLVSLVVVGGFAWAGGAAAEHGYERAMRGSQSRTRR
ncbi:peptidoglycan-binding domain-containing protein [Archangium sp.]|jgi:peptidoglycan hydrolase-like protein with peptidoglycan-binding domain|uniref:peptidoglycan-binding domain-containing protein n=1 Tax=Archangium sp. TaxID=1872627 RepID=UPI002ED77D5A